MANPNKYKSLSVNIEDWKELGMLETRRIERDLR